MADIPIFGTLAPGGSSAIVRDSDLFGGMRVVASIAARDAIPAAHKTVGMLVFVQADSTLYRLQSISPEVWIVGAGFGIANWTAATRFFAVDYDGGSDTNIGYSDASMAAAGTVAKKTWEGLMAIMPTFGVGKNVEIAIKARAAGATYRNAANTANAVLDLTTLYQYTSRFSVRGTATDTTASSTAFADDTNDQIFMGARRASGTNSAGYKITKITTPVLSATNAGPIVVTHDGTVVFTTGERVRITGAADSDSRTDSYLNAPAGWVITVLTPTTFSLNNSNATNMADVDGVVGGTITRFRLTKADGSAAALPTSLANMRLRGDVTNTTVATRNLCRDIFHSTTNTIVFNPSQDLDVVDPSLDVFYLEDPGVAFVSFVCAGRGNVFRIAGIRCIGGAPTPSVVDCSATLSFCTGAQLTVSSSPSLTISPNWVNASGTNRVVGGVHTLTCIVNSSIASMTNLKVNAQNDLTFNDCDNFQLTFLNMNAGPSGNGGILTFNRCGELSVSLANKTIDQGVVPRIVSNNSNGYLDTVQFEGPASPNGLFQTAGTSMRWLVNKLYDARTITTAAPGMLLGNLSAVPATDTLVNALTPSIYLRGTQTLTPAWLASPNPTSGNAAVWTNGPNNAWVVGNTGVIAHWTGGAWSLVPSGVITNLTGIWGASSSDIWAVGVSGTTLHWNGGGWSPVSNGTTSFAGIWGSASNDVWAVGTGGLIKHWDGASWSTVASGTSSNLIGVHGTGPNDVWAVGGTDVVLHWNGSAWSVFSPAPTSGQNLFSVFALTSNDVWVGAGNGHMLRWNGSSWTDFNLSALIAGQSTRAIWAAATNDVWAGGNNSLSSVIHWNGSAWSNVAKQPINAQVLGMAGNSASDIWAVGSSGAISRYRARGVDFAEISLNGDYNFRSRDFYFSDIADSYGNRVFLSYFGVGGANNFVRPPLPMSAFADNQADIGRYKVVRVTSLETAASYSLAGSSVKHVELAQANTLANASGALMVNRINTFGATSGAVNIPTVVFPYGPQWVISDDLPTPGEAMYLSPTTAGNITKTTPAVSGTNQKRKVGTAVDAVSYEGENRVLVIWAPDAFAVTADGNP